MKFSAAIPAMTLPLVAVVAHAHLARPTKAEDPSLRQIEAPETPAAIPDAPPELPAPPQTAELPADSSIPVTPLAEITSDRAKKGDVALFQIASDVTQNGIVVIPRGAPVKATVTSRWGKGLFGRNAKFEITFNSVTIAGVEFPLKGMHHQEGRGAEGKAKGDILAGAAAVMVPGQVVNAITGVAITGVAPQGPAQSTAEAGR